MSAGAVGAAPSRIMGVALGLLLLGGLAAMLYLREESAIDPDAVLAELFERRDLPEGLEVARAARLASGEQLVRIVAPDAPPEAPKAQVDPVAEQEGPGIDWLHLPEGPAGTLPVELMLVRYPPERAKGELERLFAAPSGPGPGGGPPQGGPPAPSGPGKRVVDRGTLPWGPFAADYVHEREYEAGGTFVDRVRLHVSVEGRYAALFLRWPRGLPASKARAGEILAGLPPRLLP